MLRKIGGVIGGVVAWFLIANVGNRIQVTDKDTRYDPRFDFVVNDPEDKGE